LLFIPIEPAFAMALNEDTTLYNKASENIVTLIQPLYWLLYEPLVCGQTKTTRKCL
jgi:DNA anti-recombination protein RmuC